MGWFFFGKSKSKARQGGSRRSKATANVGPSWDPKRTLAAARLLVGFAVLVTVVVGWRWADQALRDYADQRHGGVVSVDQVELADAPWWMDSTLQRELQAFVAQRVTGGPLDGQSLRDAAVDLQHQPWVAQLHQVRRVAGGRVIVEADYREPVAIVQGRDGYHLVDANGIRLPGLYGRHQLDAVGLPVIIGVASAPAPAGERWPGRDVQAGLALSQLLRHQPFADQIEAYDVSQRDERGRQRLVLRTTAGGMVRWGLPPGEENGIEPSPATKTQWLLHVHQRLGGIDAGGRVVDVYGGAPQISQPTITRGEPSSSAAGIW